jgi:hypothetical protein
MCNVGHMESRLCNPLPCCKRRVIRPEKVISRALKCETDFLRQTDNGGCPDPRPSKCFFFLFFLGNSIQLNIIIMGMNDKEYLYTYTCWYGYTFLGFKHAFLASPYGGLYVLYFIVIYSSKHHHNIILKNTINNLKTS